MALSWENDGIILFGQNVRAYRKAKKLSMQALAHLAEIELSQISRIETGKINPKLSTILIIAKALDISPNELFTKG
ncbi:helix-turn-helix domain-containing protein [Mucilaginibacter paludis]|uniref:Helix-turn-helix domain protein n=1 Tax=Mucilaginibacter paludis DSM 18603 TaxID=714943 RepID=H1Y5L8_9SPHI|nr:helix-turn-helix domain protein [Mucilaginibacter paludis DSM 18603]